MHDTDTTSTRNPKRRFENEAEELRELADLFASDADLAPLADTVREMADVWADYASHAGRYRTLKSEARAEVEKLLVHVFVRGLTS